nr:site-specific integrase [Pseudoruegeria sp. HB172150]
MISLKPTPKGEARYGVRWKDETGKMRQRSFANRWEAQNFRAEREVAAPRKRRKVNPIFLDNKIAFREAAAAYLHHLEFPEPGIEPKEPVTLRAYRSILEEHVILRVGRKLVRNITSDDYKLIFLGCKETGMSPRTRDEALRLFRAVLSYAQANGYIEHVPDKPLMESRSRAEKQAEKEASERKYYSPDEVFTMLAAADALAQDDNKQTRRTWARYRPMLHLLVYSGARISEARAFRRQDYAPQEGRIYIRQSAPEGKGSNNVKATASYRWVPLHPALRDTLEAYIQTHNRELLFGTKTDHPISLPTLYPRLLDPLKDQADLLAASGSNARYVKVHRDRQFHAFRHHFASWLVRRGANLKQLQKYMGHTKASFTLDVYGHLFEDDGQELMERMTL